MSVRGFYINLDRDEARRQAVEAELAKIGRPYQRFAAVDGRTLPQRADVANPSELGCFLSHLGVIRQNLGSADWLHIVEDDVLVSRHCEQAIGTILGNAEHHRNDIIFTNVLFPSESWLVARMREMFDSMVTTGPEGEVSSIEALGIVRAHNVDFLLTTSYLVNPNAIARVEAALSRALDKGFVPIDKTLQDLARAGELAMAFTVPFFTLPGLGQASSIREGVSTWRFAHMIMEAAFYADRDVPALRRSLGAIPGGTGPQSITADLVAEAFRRAVSSAER